MEHGVKRSRSRTLALLRHDGGASAVEFAIVFPFVVFMMAAFIGVASFIIHFEHLNAAARESARFAALSQSTTADVRSRALDAMPAARFVSTPTVDVYRRSPGSTTWEGPLAATERPCNQIAEGESRVRVQVTGAVRPEVPLANRTTLTMSAQGVYRCE
jgi:Flp pilus assembly protein TadG